VDGLESARAAACILLAQGETKLTCFPLDYFNCNELLRVLNLADQLGTAMEVRIRILRGSRDRAEHRSCERIW
jgi:hypothetical protein